MFERNGIPLYIQLKEKLLEDIEKNYKPNDIIPPEGKLEQEYQVSRITVRKAIEELERENIVVKKQGKGTYVKEKTVLYDANMIGSLTQRLHNQNRILTTKSKFFKIITKDEEHFTKELLSSDTLLCMKRTRLLEGTPFALMTNYFDINKVPTLEKNFNQESLYAFIKEEYGIELHSSDETVEAVAANASEAQQLEIEEGKPLLSLKRLSYDKNGLAIEFSHLLIKADMYKHKIKLVND